MKEKIVIVGAGLVGSLWAVLMAKRGYKVEVYERRGDMRAAGFVGGRSINLAMSTRGWRALEKAGVADKIRKDALPMRGRMMHSTEGDLAFQPYGKEDEAIYSVSRGGLNLELITAADSYPNVRFHFDFKCKGVDFETNTVEFFNYKTKKIRKVKADFIFGADGAYSGIRGSMQKTPRFNFQQNYLKHGYKELTFSPTASGEHAMDTESLHIWPRGTFMLIALPNPDGTFTGTLFMPYVGDPGFDDIHNDEDVLKFFKKYFPDAIPMMPELYDDFRENPVGDLVTMRCDPWQVGNVLLMGDSSHAIVPFYGQGMNSGFEDCSILDEMADEYKEDWSVIFKKFSDSRPKDANAIADLALRNFIEMRDSVGNPKFLLRKKIAGHLHKNHPEFLPVYSMVSFSNLPYSQALAETVRQDKMFEEILAIENIEENWDGAEVEAIFKKWMK